MSWIERVLRRAIRGIEGPAFTPAALGVLVIAIGALAVDGPRVSLPSAAIASVAAGLFILAVALAHHWSSGLAVLVFWLLALVEDEPALGTNATLAVLAAGGLALLESARYAHWGRREARVDARVRERFAVEFVVVVGVAVVLGSIGLTIVQRQEWHAALVPISIAAMLGFLIALILWARSGAPDHRRSTHR